MISFETLKEKVQWVRKETLKLHKNAPESRVASCLSDIEIFVSLYYGGILKYDSQNIEDKHRDRLIISKGHGGVSLYPVLADLGFFDKDELGKIGSRDSFLGAIPDANVPGIETTNGSLGHGLGVACGMAIAFKRKGLDSSIFVLSGDGELNEGSVWEAVMFASYHKLDNLILIVDNNKISMLDYQKNILGLEPIEDKFKSFGWQAQTTDGHNLKKLHTSLSTLKAQNDSRPKVLIADTVKGKGVASLEGDSLCHVKSLKPEQIDDLINSL